MEEEELEAIRRRRLQQLLLQQQLQQQELQRQIEQQEQLEAQIRLLMAKILTPEARARLGNIRVAKPEFARQVELLLIQLYQAGRLPQKVTDEQLKAMLQRISQQQQQRRVRIRRA